MTARVALLFATVLAIGEAIVVEPAAAADAEQWHELFNGKDLSGWTIKIANRPLNDNYADTDAQRLLAAGAPLQLSFGHIALQAEGQPIWFRSIRIRQLDD